MKRKDLSFPSLSFLGSIALVLLMAWPAGAQEQRGAIQGVVTDDTGAVLPGVTVEARSPRMAGVEVAVTNERGRYRFPALPPGEYELTANMPGFNTGVVSGVNLSLGQLLTVPMALTIAGVAETVTVTGESPLIDTKQSASFANINEELMESLPKERDFTSLVTIAPGANAEEKVAGISIDGAPASENRYIIDGVDTTDLFDGKPAKQLITDHLEEVQVKSSGYNAEYGGATGGVINVITKSGSNEFRGSLVAYLVNDALIASPRQSLRLSPESHNIAEYITYPEDGYRRIEPGFTLGGPILQDRAWFFASYIPSLERTERDVTFLNGEFGSYASTNNTHFFTTNLTGQITDAMRGRFSLTVNNRYEEGSLPNEAGDQDPRSDFAALGEEKPNASYAANFDYTPSENIYINVRGGYFAYNFVENGRPEGIRYSMTGNNATEFPEISEELARPNGWTSGPANRAFLQNDLKRAQFHSSVTYYTEAAGQHTFKAGIQYDRPTNDVQREELGMNISVYWDRVRATTYEENVRGTYGYWRGNQRIDTGYVSSNDMGLFLQDSWTIADKLTLNIGIRTEKQKIPSYTPEGLDINFNFADKISPRFGFAYDMNGKTKIYGSYGNFFDTMKLNLPRQLFGGENSKSYYFPLETLDWTTLGADGCVPKADIPRQTGIVCQGTEMFDYSDGRAPSNNPDDSLLDPDLKPMESREWSFGIEHELNPTTSVTARYVHKELVRTIEDVGIVVPGWGPRYYIANPGFGISEFIGGTHNPPQPPAMRDYDGLEFRIRRRFANNFAVNASYLYSRLYGTYSGLSDSDSIRTSDTETGDKGQGRSSPNTNSVFDNLVKAYDENQQAVFGRLGTDRPHQVKLQASYAFDFGTNVGISTWIANGTPLSRSVRVHSTIFYQGRMSDGRTPTYSNFDLHVGHRFILGPGSLELKLNVRNLFNQDAPTTYHMTETQDRMSQSLDEFFEGGWSVQEMIKEQNITLDPRFKQPWWYQFPREFRLGIAYQF